LGIAELFEPGSQNKNIREIQDSQHDPIYGFLLSKIRSGLILSAFNPNGKIYFFSMTGLFRSTGKNFNG